MCTSSISDQKIPSQSKQTCSISLYMFIYTYGHRNIFSLCFIASMQNNPPNPSKLSCMIAVCHRQPVHVPEEYSKISYSKTSLASCKIFIYSRNVENSSSDCLKLIHSFHRYQATSAISSSVKGVSSIQNYNSKELNTLAKSWQEQQYFRVVTIVSTLLFILYTWIFVTFLLLGN